MTQALSVAQFWDRWKRFAHLVGDVQARILLTVLYGVVVSVFAVPYRLLADPLSRDREGPSFWIPRETDEPTLLGARRQ